MQIKKSSFHSTLKRNKTNIIFIFLLIAISFLYNYHQILMYRPYSIHQWRQADCLSITMNYYMEGRNFFEPKIHWLCDGKDGKTISEFPIIYYTVAQLWKVFGHREFIFRLINILIVFTGLFCLFRLLTGILSDAFWAIVITLLLFTSPILVYYTNNFTADAPAFGIALIACLFLWNGFKKQSKIWYYFAFLFFLLAGLIKISSLLSFFVLFIIHIYLVFSGKNEKSWIFKWYNLIPYLIILTIIVGWYRYAVYYNENNVSGVFLTGIYPIWELDATEIKNNWQFLQNNLLPAYFNKIALYINLALFISLFFFIKKLNKLFFTYSLLIFSGVVAYCILFYKAFTVHDYYLTNMLVFFPLPIITMLEMLRHHYPKLYQSIYLKIFAILALLVLIYQTTVINRMKYSADDIFVKDNLATGQMEKEYWAWYHYDYGFHSKAYETITPYLRKIGLKRTDRCFMSSGY